MENMNTKFFVMLTLLAVSQMNVQAMEEDEYYEDVEIQSHREDGTFLGQMGRLQNQMHDVKRDARNSSRAVSYQQLNAVEAGINALEANPEFKGEAMHAHRIRVLRRELQHARNIVRDHGLEDRGNVRVQGILLNPADEDQANYDDQANSDDQVNSDDQKHKIAKKLKPLFNKVGDKGVIVQGNITRDAKAVATTGATA